MAKFNFKKHAIKDKSKHPHKREYYVQNDENYCMAIYEGENKKGNKKRSFELINNLDFAKLRKGSDGFYQKNKKITLKGEEALLPIINRNNKDVILKRGLLAIFFEKDEFKNNINEILNSKTIQQRLYKIIGLSIQRIGKSEYGVIKLKLHNEARLDEEINKDNFKPDGEFKLGENKPTRKMNHNQFNALIEGVDFKITPLGKIEKV